MQPSSPSPSVAAPPPRKRTARRVLTGLGVAALVLCGLPAGWLGIRFLTYETGPINELPDVCSVIDNDALREFIGEVPGQHERTTEDGTDPQDSCQWHATDPSRMVTVTANRYLRRWNESSVDRARAWYNIHVLRFGGFTSRDSVPLGGDQYGECVGGFGRDFVLTYLCVARVENVVIDVEVLPSTDPPPTSNVDVDQVRANVETLADGLSRALVEDLAEDL